MNACVLFSLLSAAAAVTTDNGRTSTGGGFSMTMATEALVQGLWKYFGEKESSDVTENRDKRLVVNVVAWIRFGAEHRRKIRLNEKPQSRHISQDSKLCPQGEVLLSPGVCGLSKVSVSLTASAPPRCPDGTVRAENEDCYELLPDPPVDDLPRCPDGTVRAENGYCYELLPDSPVKDPLRCPDGMVRAENGYCYELLPDSPVNDPLRCPDRMIRAENGYCYELLPEPSVDDPLRCPNGTVRAENGGCYELLPHSPVDDPLKCPDGTVRAENGDCYESFPDPPVDDPPRCPDGTVSTGNGDCYKLWQYQHTSQDSKLCPYGEVLLSSGVCGPSTLDVSGTDSAPPRCPDGTVSAENGDCYESFPDPPVDDPSRCPDGTVRAENGDCYAFILRFSDQPVVGSVEEEQNEEEQKY